MNYIAYRKNTEVAFYVYVKACGFKSCSGIDATKVKTLK